MAGYTLELFYKDGRPDGLVTAEVFGWTGHLLKLPRTRLPDVLTRAEAEYTGVYLLLGEEEQKISLYIGETDRIGWRFREHEAKKDWWTHAIWVTAAANKLNKAHVRYLEARLYEEAIKVGRSDLKNSQRPTRPSLSEAEVANMEAFLAQILMALPALRVDAFIETARPAAGALQERSSVAAPTAQFKLENRKNGLVAYAFVKDGEFIVEKGSMARKADVNQSGYARLHQDLSRSGKLSADGENCRFTENIAFSSPSAAASVVTGRSANGTVDWRTIDGNISYKDWETAQISAFSGH